LRVEGVKPGIEQSAYGRPFGVGDREHRAVAQAARLTFGVRRLPVAEDTFEGRAKCGDRGARTRVAGVGLEVDPADAGGFERVRQQEQLRFDVDTGALGRSRDPGAADLDRVVADLEKAGAAD